MQWRSGRNTRRGAKFFLKPIAVSMRWATRERVETMKVGGVVVSSAAYNDTLHQTTYKDALNQATTYKYDGLGRVAKITNALRHARNFTYDKDRLSTETDFNNNTTTYSNYDGGGSGAKHSGCRRKIHDDCAQ